MILSRRDTTMTWLLFLVVALLEARASIYCYSEADTIRLGNDSTKTYFCESQTTNAEVLQFRWETNNTSTEGLNDDEYYVHVLQDGVPVYSTDQQFGAAMGSATIATAGRGGLFQVQIECNLEAFFKHCEDGTLSFALVECGCPDGTVETSPCTTGTGGMGTASNAECLYKGETSLFDNSTEVAPEHHGKRRRTTPATVVVAAVGGLLLVACASVFLKMHIRQKFNDKTLRQEPAGSVLRVPQVEVEAQTSQACAEFQRGQIAPDDMVTVVAEVVYPNFKDQVHPST